jgi:hypothetical protein
MISNATVVIKLVLTQFSLQFGVLVFEIFDFASQLVKIVSRGVLAEMIRRVLHRSSHVTTMCFLSVRFICRETLALDSHQKSDPNLTYRRKNNKP